MSPPSNLGSYQLPDLLSQFQDHDLRINNHCRSATVASETWVRDLAARVGETSNSPALALPADRLSKMKIGLLGASSFPSCDLTQLILMIDVLTLIILNTQILKSDPPPTKSPWGIVNETSYSNYTELLQTHPLLQQLLPRLSRLRNTTSEFWQQRFTSSIAAYYHSEQDALNYRPEGTVRVAGLGIDEYIDFRRDFSGMPIILDLIEAVEGLELDIPMYNEDLRTLRRLVGDIIVLSWDVFSYNIDQSVGNRLNIVSLLQSRRDNALVHSIREAGNLIFQKIESFKLLENSLLKSVAILPSAPASNTSTTVLKSSWLSFTGLFSDPHQTNNSPSTSVTKFQAHDIALYIRALKDCMVGFLNWTYETDMFFGTKGESVKSFGWVFLLPPLKSTSTNETSV